MDVLKQAAGGPQEVLNLCGDRGIVSEIEVVPIEDINDAFKRIDKGEVRYRFVIDIENPLKSE